MSVVLTGAAGLLGGCSSKDAPDNAAATSAIPGVSAVQATLETVAVAGSGDAADDPAVWAADIPDNSKILGTDKKSGLYVYHLDGSVAQYLEVGRLNNVDVRRGFDAGGRQLDIAVASDRTHKALAVFFIDPASGQLEAAPGGLLPLPFAEPYGVCLYRDSADDALYAFVTDKDPGDVAQMRLGFADGKMTGDIVRRFRIGSVSEGCVADERTGALYVSEETRAVWRYGARPGDGDARSQFAPVADAAAVARGEARIAADAEGLALLPQGERGGWLFVSSQGDSTYAVFELETGNAAGRFRIADSDTIDATTETDGIEVYPGSLGAEFPMGAFLAQDDVENSGGQNFKLVPLERIREALNLQSDG